MALVNVNKSALLLKNGTGTPTAANFIEVLEPILVQPEIGGGEFSRITGKLNTGNQRYNDLNNVRASFTASVLLRSNDKAATALNTPPEIGEALKCAGFDEIITSTLGSESVEYVNSQSPTGGTALVYIDGNKFTFEAGSVVANPTFNFTVGEQARVEFEMQGFLVSATPASEALQAVTISDEKHITVSKIDLITVDARVIKAENVTISMNNTIEAFYTMGGADALKSMEILDNGITLTASFYVDGTEYGLDYTDLETQALKAIDIKLGVNASSVLVNGQSIHITAGSAQAQKVTNESQQDRVFRTVTYRLNNDATDKALSLLYGTFA